MHRYLHAWAVCLLCAAGLLSCEQSLVRPEKKAPFDFPYDSLSGNLYMQYVEHKGRLAPEGNRRQQWGLFADAGTREGLVVTVQDRAYLRQDNQLWLAAPVMLGVGDTARVADTSEYRYVMFDPVQQAFLPDTVSPGPGIPVGITGNDSIHVLLPQGSGGNLEIRWMIHDLARKETHLRQVIPLSGDGSTGYEAIGGSVVFPGGQKLLLRTGSRYLICDGTSAAEITLEGENPFDNYALSIDPAGRTLAYTHLPNVGAANRVYFRNLESGAETSYVLPEGLFLASAWAPGGEPRVLLAGWSGLLEVDTAGVSRQRITISSQRRTHFFNGVQWNP